MSRQPMDVFDHYAAVMKAMRGEGLLLGSYDEAGKANFMTIGWGTLGYIWRMPIWAVLVRPSRYTYECIEHSKAFTVCVPTPAMTNAVGICGSQSGRDHDKVALAGLTAEASPLVAAPTEAQCPIVYHCKVVEHNDLLAETMDPEIQSLLYAAGDYHRVYFGEVLGADAAPDVTAMLG
jgi:flavin reductase (DIM6/NTAB) family NADH-FMN oxidoreductase RutF